MCVICIMQYAACAYNLFIHAQHGYMHVMYAHSIYHCKYITVSWDVFACTHNIYIYCIQYMHAFVKECGCGYVMYRYELLGCVYAVFYLLIDFFLLILQIGTIPNKKAHVATVV